MKGIYKLECILLDQHGHHVHMGDEIEVNLPYRFISHATYPGDDAGVQFAPKKVRGIIGLRLSRGLILKVTGVEYISGYTAEEDDRELKIDQFIPFKRFAWDWKVITPVDRIVEVRRVRAGEEEDEVR